MFALAARGVSDRAGGGFTGEFLSTEIAFCNSFSATEDKNRPTSQHTDNLTYMTTEKREQVFISSTFKDLQEERRAVTQVLLQADAIPAGMELFPASDSQKFDLIKRVIDLCDYYVVIVGGRYGSVDVEDQLSYTEKEYDYAVERGIPVMAFLHSDPGSLTANQTELEPDRKSVV